MKRYVEGVSRHEPSFPPSLEELIADDNPVRVVDTFVNNLDLLQLGFTHIMPSITGRPSYHPSDMLKLFIYGYLNHIDSSRCLERETLRNVEVMWLLRHLTPDHKTIANFRKDNGEAIQRVCHEFTKHCEDGNSSPATR